MIVVDYIAHFTRTWWIPNSILSYRLFDFVTIEILFWVYLNVYCVVMFYETFLDRTHRMEHSSPRLKVMLFAFLAVLGIFILLFSVFPSALYIHYWYSSFGIMLMPIVIIQFFLYPKMFWRMVKTIPYFFIYVWFTRSLP